MYRFIYRSFLLISILMAAVMSSCHGDDDAPQPVVVPDEVSRLDTGLPVVCVVTPDSADITSKTEWTDGATITIYRADGTIDYSDDNLSIRGRGNTTWEYPKKPYALKLSSKSELLGMPQHKRWVLLANWMDRTLLRNEFAFQIASNTGLAWTPRGCFVEVLLNGQHIGNYYLCEQIRVDKNRVNITDGYLMELDAYFDEANKFKSAYRGLPYMFKEPDEHTLQPEQQQYMIDYVNHMEQCLYADDWLVSREYAQYLDLESFADWWFVHELAQNAEPCWPKSSYMYKDGSGKLTAGPVWDFDYHTFVPDELQFHSLDAIYYKRLFADPEFVALVKYRWAMFKPRFLAIPDKIRSEAEYIRRSEALNHELWPIGSPHVNEDGLMTFDTAVSRLISAYNQKLSWLDQQIAGL